MKVLIVNGPNLNKTGEREPVYGTKTLDQINADIKSFCDTRKVNIEFFQSNSEGDIINRLQSGGFDALVINGGAYTHYSLAIADALYSVKTPKIEVHLSNILAREDFRAVSVFAKNTDGAIIGLGADGYKLAIEHIICQLSR